MSRAYDYECPKCGAPPGSFCVGHEGSPRVHVERHGSRERSQMVIALGEGDKGLKLKSFLERAAAHSGKPVSVWAREALMQAALELAIAGKIEEP